MRCLLLSREPPDHGAVLLFHQAWSSCSAGPRHLDLLCWAPRNTDVVSVRAVVIRLHLMIESGPIRTAPFSAQRIHFETGDCATCKTHLVLPYQPSISSWWADSLTPLSGNGDFRKKFGILLGALLYLRSISAARGHSYRT